MWEGRGNERAGGKGRGRKGQERRGEKGRGREGYPLKMKIMATALHPSK